MKTVSLEEFRATYGWIPDQAVDHCYATREDRQVINSINAALRPERVLEFGINEGRQAELMLRTSPWIRHYCGIDVYPDFIPAWSQQRGEIPGEGKVGRFVKDDRLHLVLSNVGSYEGIQALTGSGYGLIYIDADHSYEGVARDTAIAYSVAAPGAAIVWHDYKWDIPSVMRFLDEIADRDALVHVGGTRIAFRRLSSSCPSSP